MKYKYKINSNFDPCSYPGIQCEFYYDMRLDTQHGIQPNAVDMAAAPIDAVAIDAVAIDAVAIDAAANKKPHAHVNKVSFMIFRTGSVLIVGKCSEEMLHDIYNFLTRMFTTDYDEIKGLITQPVNGEKKEKQRKLRKKTILV